MFAANLTVVCRRRKPIVVRLAAVGASVLLPSSVPQGSPLGWGTIVRNIRVTSEPSVFRAF
jgi:hypothetical protein